QAVAVRAHIARGDLAAARAALAALAGLPPAAEVALRWEVALLALLRALEASETPWAEALGEVQGLPPWDGLAPARARAAGRALALLRPLLERAGAQRLAPEDAGRFLAFCRLHRALLPGAPIPRQAVAPVLANISTGRRDLELSVALTEGVPDDLEV